MSSVWTLTPGCPELCALSFDWQTSCLSLWLVNCNLRGSLQTILRVQNRKFIKYPDTSMMLISILPVLSQSSSWKASEEDNAASGHFVRTKCLRPLSQTGSVTMWTVSSGTYWTWPPVWPGSRRSCQSRWSHCRRSERQASDTTCCSVWTLRTAEVIQESSTNQPTN